MSDSSPTPLPYNPSHPSSAPEVAVTEYHSVKAFAREEPRIELIEATLRSLLALVELEFEGEPVKVDGFRLRDLEDWRTAPDAALQVNLGSLSAACNCRCEFCYEEGNPPGLFEREPRFVGLQEARTRARHLRDGRGLPRESKSSFEPLTNPDYLELMRLVRAQDPGQLIDLTTNGVLLDEEMIAALAELAPVWVNLSLNSVDPAMRGRLMGDRRAAQAVGAPELLRAYGIPFQGSLVPWPAQGLDDLARTIEYLDACEAQSVRIALPALTRHHPRYRPEVLREWLPAVCTRAEEVRRRIRTPVLISPYTYVTNSPEALVAGVVRRSPAEAAGVAAGDRLLAVDGRKVVSRSHAASLLMRALPQSRVALELAREEGTFAAVLKAPPQHADRYPYQPRGYARLDSPSMLFGLCLPGAFQLASVKLIHEAVCARKARRPLVVASAHFRDLAAELLAELPLPSGTALELIVPASRLFGGDVDLGDLWVLEDIAAAVRAHMRDKGRPDLLLMPGSFLSRWGRDLLGVPFTELESALGLPVALIPCERILV